MQSEEIKLLLKELQQSNQTNRDKWQKINTFISSALIGVMCFLFIGIESRLTNVEKRSQQSTEILREVSTQLKFLNEQNNTNRDAIIKLQERHMKD